MFTTKHLFFAHFSTKTGDFFCIGKMEKYHYFAKHIFSIEKSDFFGDFGQKREGLIR